MCYFWYILGTLWILGLIWTAYEIWKAPLMPDDFDAEITDEELNQWLYDREHRTDKSED